MSYWVFISKQTQWSHWNELFFTNRESIKYCKFLNIRWKFKNFTDSPAEYMKAVFCYWNDHFMNDWSLEISLISVKKHSIIFLENLVFRLNIKSSFCKICCPASIQNRINALKILEFQNFVLKPIPFNKLFTTEYI